MEYRELDRLFDAHGAEHCKFERVLSPAHPRPDVCAFVTLDRLCPAPGKDMVSATGHDEIFLSVDIDVLCAAASEEDIILLIRCGVRLDPENCCLCMFV